MVLGANIEDQHKFFFYLPKHLVMVVHMLAVLVIFVFLVVEEQVDQINHLNLYLQPHLLY